MIEKNFSTSFKHYESYNALPEFWQNLYLQAKEACLGAYAPYSEFQVGAAIALGNGEIITGSNQENAAYPSGLCAERTALFYIGHKFPKEEIVAIAIAAHRIGEDVWLPLSPCGSCRQVMIEFLNKQEKKISIMLPSKADSFSILDSVSLLLPFAFTKESL